MGWEIQGQLKMWWLNFAFTFMAAQRSRELAGGAAERQHRLAVHQRKGIGGNAESIKCKLHICVCACVVSYTRLYVTSINHQNGLQNSIEFAPWDKRTLA